MEQIRVNKQDLLEIYREAKSVVKRMQLILAEVGCLHRNKQNVTTMGDQVQKYYCPDCGETFEGVK